MSPSFFVSAYATSPSFNTWDAPLESQYFRQLSNITSINGIEHPFLPDSDKYSLPWLIENIPSHWSIILTALPIFMTKAKDNPLLGLASLNERGRSQAVLLMEKMSYYIHKLHQAFNRPIVQAVHFHSFPRNDKYDFQGDKEALHRSLIEMQNMDWHEASLNLEHCDAYIPNQKPDKGFLSLQDEIEVLSQFDDYGIILNWARSAIEGRSSLTPATHIEMATKENLLKGFFFSGCTNNPGSEYGCWKDTHMPIHNFIERAYLDNDSLLGEAEIKQTFELLKPGVYLGLKTLNPSSNKRDLARSIGLNRDSLAALQHVFNNTQSRSKK